MHRNLRGIYLDRGDLARTARVIDRLARLEPAEPRHRRDRAAAAGVDLARILFVGPPKDLVHPVYTPIT